MSETSRELSTDVADPLPEIGSLWRVPDLGTCKEWASPTAGTILQLEETLQQPPASNEIDVNTLSCRFVVLFGEVPDHWGRNGYVHLNIGLTPEARSYLLFNLEQVKED